MDLRIGHRLEAGRRSESYIYIYIYVLIFRQFYDGIVNVVMTRKIQF